MKKDNKTNVSKNILSILPIRKYDDKLGGFIYCNESYMDLFSIIPSDRANLQEDELQYSIFNNIKFYRLYSGDIKLISMNFPVNTSYQREFLKKKYKQATDKVRRLWLEREMNELELLDQNVMRKEYYLMFFGKDKDEFIKNKDNIEKWIGHGRSRLVQELSKEKKIQIVRKLCNMNSLILPDELEEDSKDDD